LQSDIGNPDRLPELRPRQRSDGKEVGRLSAIRLDQCARCANLESQSERIGLRQTICKQIAHERIIRVRYVLRGPSINGRAFLVRTNIGPLFANGDGPVPSSSTIPVAVPGGTGIRDLARLADGRLLLLLGPAQEQGLPYGLARVEPPSAADVDVPIKVETLAELPEIAVGDSVGKAEAIVVLKETAAELEVLVLFDGLKNGAPRRFRIPLH
jgi:hypothetical protein